VGDVSDARIAQAIERYLRSGEHEHDHPEWPGNLWDRAKKGHDDLLDALVTEAQRRADGRTHAPVPADLDLISWTRRELKPMVDGLFPQVEREAVLALLEQSVVFLTAANIEAVLRDQSWLHSAWDLANLYLSSVDAELLGPEAPSLLGLSQETTCYVSAEYFAERGRFNDYVIHEAAHVFHNWKRRNAGLRETRTREWLLEIEFRKRETFAYSCEAYGWIVEHARTRGEKIAMGQEYAAGVSRFGDEHLDANELASIVGEACGSRNGWKVILRRCRATKMTRREVLARLAQGAGSRVAVATTTRLPRMRRSGNALRTRAAKLIFIPSNHSTTPRPDVRRRGSAGSVSAGPDGQVDSKERCDRTNLGRGGSRNPRPSRAGRSPLSWRRAWPSG
jgi:hypothetical protein